MKEIVLSVGVNDVYKTKTKVSLGDIVFWLEFGTETIPPRPAIQMGVDIAINRHKKMIQAYLKNYFMAITMKDQRAAKQLIQKQKRVLFTQIGRSAVKEIKNIISEGSTIGNAPATIAKKGFDHPLFHEGDYLENVNYEVREA